jgi:glycine cleavage system transcriptional repressor
VGQDRPGIVAGVAEALWRLGCNLEDTSMTLLRSEFAMILLVRRPPELAEAALEAALHPVGAALALEIACKELTEGAALPDPRRGAGFVASVYGADRPGIVYRVARLLAERGINITDLSTRVLDREGAPVYVMLLDLDAPPSIAEEELRAALEPVATELSVTISVRPMDEEAL